MHLKVFGAIALLLWQVAINGWKRLPDLRFWNPSQQKKSFHAFGSTSNLFHARIELNNCGITSKWRRLVSLTDTVLLSILVRCVYFLCSPLTHVSYGYWYNMLQTNIKQHVVQEDIVIVTISIVLSTRCICMDNWYQILFQWSLLKRI